MDELIKDEQIKKENAFVSFLKAKAMSIVIIAAALAVFAGAIVSIDQFYGNQKLSSSNVIPSAGKTEEKTVLEKIENSGDAAIDAEVVKLDNSMKSLEEEVSGVDTSLNDKAVNLD